ncbi:uncharacterized protein N0V89_002807 [Didymosphaeria variabile]|uniref:VOC domain-containing protein n=1 Tax=Didymosphaeria variabile TaxID=1932322 RepID=A0A9W8XSC5_9PLEO|nr:uncharacterized protein N0V89_002807 [Didymosphaeria variabile]KAJ4358227.1 hypothetical protein N0V89_002807 [Didymosphaeria variabile]
MAEQFLEPYTVSVLANILEPQYNGSIGRAAAWADGYAHTDEETVQKGGCVVSAIDNQTSILKGCISDVKAGSLDNGANLTCSYALKWVSHFLGDIAQPLHASGRAAGGNFVRVKFGNVSTELHAVWDHYIPYTAAKATQPFSNETIAPFFEYLVSRIRKDLFLGSSIYVASIRLNATSDLAADGYAAGGVPIVELQISKAALRLATWLNKLVGEERQKQFDQHPSRETSPARGATIPQDAAVPADRKLLREWQASQHIDRDAQVKITKVSHMRYQHPDLAEITTFLRDFGMSVAQKAEGKRWFKGYGTDQYLYYAQQGEKKFLGGAFEVESYAELEKAAGIPGASAIQGLTDAPGGGYMVTVYDPEGFPINLIYGQIPKSSGPMPEVLQTNYEVQKPRVAAFQRFKPGPAAVHKLGHYGLCVTQFPAQLAFYTRSFNFAPTDFLYVQDEEGEKKDVATFLHIDIGPNFTDHHTFFMSSNPTAHVHHCSFEVHDFDAQNLGHEWLAKKGYKSVWGVGRHILGSQIFDYWWDTTGNMIEHYADGDLVNEETPVGWGAAGDESLAVWGPEVPGWFLD